MRKIKRLVLHGSMQQLTVSQMQELKGGDSKDYFYCACSCNDTIGMWFDYCHVDLLRKDQYDYRSCGGGNGYYRCSPL